ncbi:hypothetical protein GOP47_0016023, partial [Adiantum capillus-veneris]
GHALSDESGRETFKKRSALQSKKVAGQHGICLGRDAVAGACAHPEREREKERRHVLGIRRVFPVEIFDGSLPLPLFTMRHFHLQVCNPAKTKKTKAFERRCPVPFLPH